MSALPSLKRRRSTSIEENAPDPSLGGLLSAGPSFAGTSFGQRGFLPLPAPRAPRVVPSFTHTIPTANQPAFSFPSTPPFIPPSTRSLSAIYPTPPSTLGVPSPFRSISATYHAPPSTLYNPPRSISGPSIFRWARLPGSGAEDELSIPEVSLSSRAVIMPHQGELSPTRRSRSDRIQERESVKPIRQFQKSASIQRKAIEDEDRELQKQAALEKKAASKLAQESAKLQTVQSKARAKELKTRNALAAREAVKAQKKKDAADVKELREREKQERAEAERLARFNAAEQAKKLHNVITNAAEEEGYFAQRDGEHSDDDEASGPAADNNTPRTLRGGPVAKRPKLQASKRKPRVFPPDSSDPIESVLKSQWASISAAADAFPPVILPTNIRKSIEAYLTNMDSMANQKSCAVCGSSCQAESISTISRDSPILLGNTHRFDKCARNDACNTIDLCKDCLSSIQHSGNLSVPKFSGRNDINTLLCDDYPECLRDLTLVEEACISRSKVIGYILRITHKNKGISYRSASGHVMAYRQNPSKLFNILPSPELDLCEYITVSWERPVPVGGSDIPSRPSDAILAKFCQVRKAKVLAALEWLCLHNPLYKDVKINRELLNTWKENFIPEILISSAIVTEPGLSDNRDGYAYDRHADSTEYGPRAEDEDGIIDDEIISDQLDIDGSTDDCSTPESSSGRSSPLKPTVEDVEDDYDPTHISTGAFLSDQESQNVSLKESQAQLFAELARVHKQAGQEDPNAPVPLPHVEYKRAFGIETLNSWTDYDYLLAAFPTVFPYGTGGHVQPDDRKRPRPVSLIEYANWLMRHHNCRAAKHHVLPYVLYDMILLRQSSLGNTIQSRNAYWAHGQVDIMSLGSEDLQSAASEMAAGQACTNPVIKRLLVNMRLLSSYNPESFGRKLAQRHVLMGHVVLLGAPSFWFTINPTDLNNPLILRLAGVTITPNLTKAQVSELRRRHALGNPALVAQYFDIVIRSFFDHLLCSATGEVGILGPIVSHFGVVESNSRMMHHLHGFAWLPGGIDFDKLGARVIQSQDFRERLASYLVSVVTEEVDLAWGERYREEHPNQHRFCSSDQHDNQEFMAELKADGNHIAGEHQMHRHTKTCFKYQQKTRARDENGDAIPGRFVIYCRFLYPRPIIPKLKKDPESELYLLPEGVEWLNPGCGMGADGSLTWSPSTGEIFLPRNHPRINRRNNAISCCLRSNHDVQWIPGSSRMLSALYYMFNYSTKDDVKMHQLVLTAALFKAAMERATATTGTLTPAQERLMKVQPGDFCMKVYHKFQREREVGAITVCGFLQKLPMFYMPNPKSRILHLYQVTSHLRKWAALSREQDSESHSDEPGSPGPDVRGVAGEPLIDIDTGNVASGFSKFNVKGSPDSVYVNFELRGPRLQEFCIYEYAAQIGVETNEFARKTSFLFHPDHPKFETHRQYSPRYTPGNSKDNLWIPSIHGTLTSINNRGKSVKDILTDSVKAENDIDECLLGLFVPWERFPQLFKEYASNVTLFPEPRDACSLIWSHIYPKLHPRLQQLSKNIRLLRRSKEAAEKDRQARALERDLWEENATIGPEDSHYEDDSLLPEQEWSTQLSVQDFQHGFLRAAEHWRNRRTGLGSVAGPGLDITALSLLPKSFVHGQEVGLEYHAETAREWEKSYKAWNKTNGEPLLADDPGTTSPDPLVTPPERGRGRGRPPRRGRGRPRGSRNATTGTRAELQPHLRQLFVDPTTLDGLKTLYATDPCLNKLMSVIRIRYKLNEKQRLTVCILLGRAMEVTDFATALREQTLAYIGGQGGTGKTMLTAGFLLGMAILGRSDQVLIVASTGSAASHIGGATIHAAMGIGGAILDDDSTPLQTLRARHSKIKFILLDEVSMVGQTLFGRVHLKAENIWKPPTDSGTVLGGIPCIITLGDFNQFQPVLDLALWGTSTNESKNRVLREHAVRVWRCFTDIVILTEQMRQKDDLHYQGLLDRAKTVSLTDADIRFLNSKTRAAKESRGEALPRTAIRTLNEERHDFNRQAIEKFAIEHGQRIWMFAATHSRSKASVGQPRISVATMLATGDDSKFKGPGILFFTPNMPFMLLANVGTKAGLSNGKMGKAVDVIMDDTAQIFELDDRYVLCSKPPVCILVDFGEPCGLQYPELPAHLQPIFQYPSGGTMNDLSTKDEGLVQRQQIPGTPAFSITDFKSQGHTKHELETDLAFSKMPNVRGHHYRWTSLNVQLGRLTSSKGLCLREEITRRDVSYYPDPELAIEIERLELLASNTRARWEKEIDSKGVVFESG